MLSVDAPVGVGGRVLVVVVLLGFVVVAAYEKGARDPSISPNTVDLTNGTRFNVFSSESVCQFYKHFDTVKHTKKQAC